MEVKKRKKVGSWEETRESKERDVDLLVKKKEKGAEREGEGRVFSWFFHA